MIQGILYRRMLRHPELFSGHYIDPRALYVALYNRVPCIVYVGEVDVTAAFRYLQEHYGHMTRGVFQHSYFDHEEGRVLFNNTLFVLSGRRIVELGAGYCQVLHTRRQYAHAHELIRALAAFRRAPVPLQPVRVVGFATQTADN